MRAKERLLLFVAVLILAGCGQMSTIATPTPVSQRLNAMSPGLRGEEFIPLLARDAILPIYHPQFVSAAESGYDDDELVMGVEIDGQAKAYPVTLLNFREMVNDELAGVPILVTF